MDSAEANGHHEIDIARQRIAGPSLALIIVSAVSLAALLISLAFSVWLLSSGMVHNLQQPTTMSKETQVIIRICWNVVMECVNVVILLGALRMRSLRNRGFAKTACILSLIPCFGPCFIVGIPFGIWGLVVMNDPGVKLAFGAASTPGGAGVRV